MSESVQTKLGPWRGVNNFAAEDEVGAEWLLEAFNYFLTGPGFIDTVSPPVRVIEAEDGSSLWSNGKVGIYKDGSTLLRIAEDNRTTAVLATGLPEGRMAAARIGDKLFLSQNGYGCRVNLRTWDFSPGLGSPNPSSYIALTRVEGGLPAGKYIVGLTFLDGLLEESGCPLYSTIELTTPGGIHVAYTGTAPSGVSRVNVYLGDSGISSMRQARRLLGGETEATITSLKRGRRLETANLEELIAGELICTYNGRLYVAVGNEVYFSEYNRPGLMHPDFNELGTYPEDVKVLLAGSAGIWVVADRVYYYQGETANTFKYRDDVFPYSAAKGSGMMVPGRLFKGKVFEEFPDEELPYWFSDRGACVGLPSGQVVAPSFEVAEPGHYEEGASGVVKMGGATQLVSSVKKPRGDSQAMRESWNVRVIQRGV